MKIVNDINKHIFRGYDIRGIYGEDLNEDVAYTIGKGFGSYIQNLGKTVAIVGYDNRASSPELSNAFIKGATETGITVYNLGLVTTPMYYYSWGKLGVVSGAMITASHNPKEYNGFKIAFDERGNACGDMIQDFRSYIEKGVFKQGNGNERKVDIKDEYINYIKSSIDLGNRKVKVVLDAGNGTASIAIKEAFKGLNVDAEYIFCDSNPDFPNHHPDPSVEDNLQLLKQKVLETGADLGLGLDGDADRVGAIDEQGNFIPVDYLMIIICRSIYDKIKNKKVLYDVKCSKSLADELDKLGLEKVAYRIGNSYMKAKMRDGDFNFGGELSGHLFFRDKFSGFDDGIYACLRLVEILSNTDKNFSELLEGINKYYSTPEIKIKSTDEEKFNVVENVKSYAISKGYNINTIDGVRVEFNDGWALVRASNTGPELTLRFEGVTEKRMNEIKDEFMGVIHKK